MSMAGWPISAIDFLRIQNPIIQANNMVTAEHQFTF